MRGIGTNLERKQLIFPLLFKQRLTVCVADLNVALTLHPELLQSSSDSFQNLHEVVMGVIDKLALIDFIPGPTMGLTTR